MAVPDRRRDAAGGHALRGRRDGRTRMGRRRHHQTHRRTRRPLGPSWRIRLDEGAELHQHHRRNREGRQGASPRPLQESDAARRTAQPVHASARARGAEDPRRDAAPWRARREDRHWHDRLRPGRTHLPRGTRDEQGEPRLRHQAARGSEVRGEGDPLYGAARRQERAWQIVVQAGEVRRKWLHMGIARR